MNQKPLTRHQRRRLQTRAQLQQALLELVLEKGYEAVSIQDVTDRADLGRGTFYVHYKDKEELLWSLVADRIHLTERMAAAGYSGVLPPKAEYYGYCNIFEHVAQNSDLYRVMLGKKGCAELTDRVRSYMVSETIKDMQQMPLYQDMGQPAEITAQIVIGSIISLAVWWLENPDIYTPRQMGAMLYEALHHQPPPVEE